MGIIDFFLSIESTWINEEGMKVSENFHLATTIKIRNSGKTHQQILKPAGKNGDEKRDSK